MNKPMNQFCEQMAVILDVATVKESDVLADFEAWDSLSVLSTIALLDSDYGVNLTAMDLKDARTVADLWKAAEAKKQA
jgi:acyl carrier protein